MTATVVRLILAASVLLVAVVVYIPVAYVLDNRNNMLDEWAFTWANIISMAILMIGWILVWANEIQWTRRRKLITASASILFLLPIGFLHILVFTVVTREEELWIVLIGMLWAVTWIPMTAIVWRETKSERIDRLKMLGINAVACPNCGYNMTGLKQAECPECGAKYTLDQLYASMRDEAV